MPGDPGQEPDRPGHRQRSFNADSENIRAIGALGFEALSLYYGTAESQEGGHAFREKRRPDFRAAGARP